MAILSFYRCEVLVNDVPLAEYDDEDTQDIPHNPTPQAIKYIEATAGSEFAIKFSLLAPWTMEDDLVWKVFLDGSQSTGSLFKKSETTAGVYSKIRDGVNVGSGNDWYWRKYTFGSLILGKLESRSLLLLSHGSAEADLL